MLWVRPAQQRHQPRSEVGVGLISVSEQVQTERLQGSEGSSSTHSGYRCQPSCGELRILLQWKRSTKIYSSMEIHVRDTETCWIMHCKRSLQFLNKYREIWELSEAPSSIEPRSTAHENLQNKALAEVRSGGSWQSK